MADDDFSLADDQYVTAAKTIVGDINNDGKLSLVETIKHLDKNGDGATTNKELASLSGLVSGLNDAGGGGAVNQGSLDVASLKADYAKLSKSTDPADLAKAHDIERFFSLTDEQMAGFVDSVQIVQYLKSKAGLPVTGSSDEHVEDDAEWQKVIAMSDAERADLMASQEFQDVTGSIKAPDGSAGAPSGPFVPPPEVPTLKPPKPKDPSGGDDDQTDPPALDDYNEVNRVTVNKQTLPPGLARFDIDNNGSLDVSELKAKQDAVNKASAIQSARDASDNPRPTSDSSSTDPFRPGGIGERTGPDFDSRRTNTTVIDTVTDQHPEQHPTVGARGATTWVDDKKTDGGSTTSIIPENPGVTHQTDTIRAKVSSGFDLPSNSNSRRQGGTTAIDDNTLLRQGAPPATNLPTGAPPTGSRGGRTAGDSASDNPRPTISTSPATPGVSGMVANIPDSHWFEPDFLTGEGSSLEIPKDFAAVPSSAEGTSTVTDLHAGQHPVVGARGATTWVNDKPADSGGGGGDRPRSAMFRLDSIGGGADIPNNSHGDDSTKGGDINFQVPPVMKAEPAKGGNNPDARGTSTAIDIKGLDRSDPSLELQPSIGAGSGPPANGPGSSSIADTFVPAPAPVAPPQTSVARDAAPYRPAASPPPARIIPPTIPPRPITPPVSAIPTPHSSSSNLIRRS